MIIGAYWSQRKESRGQAATRIATFFGAVTSRHQVLSKWLFTANTKAGALRRELVLDVESIGRALTVNRTDVGRQPMPELGFSLGVWNGGNVTFSAPVGCYSQYVGNAAVLSFANTNDWLGEAHRRDVLIAMVSAFDPEHAVVASRQLLNRVAAKNVWDAGWITYEQGVGIREHAV